MVAIVVTITCRRPFFCIHYCTAEIASSLLLLLVVVMVVVVVVMVVHNNLSTSAQVGAKKKLGARRASPPYSRYHYSSHDLSLANPQITSTKISFKHYSAAVKYYGSVVVIYA